MNKRTLSFIFILSIFSFMSYADPISIELSKTAAKNLYFERTGINQHLSLDDIKPVLIYIQKQGIENIYFVFNIEVFGEIKGFVIVAADNDVIPFLGYSFENSFDTNQIPEVLKNMLLNYQIQINYVQVNQLKADQNIKSLWEKYTRNTFYPTRDIQTSSPLLKSKWGQGSYYNSQIPFNYPVGCVALSMGEVMRYYSYPPRGNGFHSYQSNIGYLDAKFGNTFYQWQNMPDILDGSKTPTQIYSTSILLRHCGISVETYYTSNGSGSNIYKIPDALTNYFNYCSAKYIQKSEYYDYVWDGILVNEINRKRPVIYGGMIPDNSVGHAFVCDGYQGSSSNYEFHIDWGWDGSFNGYYKLSSLNPGTYNFTKTQKAVTNINPYRLCINGDLIISSNPVRQYSTISITAKITNFNTSNYKGGFDAILTDTSGAVVSIIDSIKDQTLAQDYVYTFNFNSKKITLPVGNYRLAIRFKNSSGSMEILPEYLYKNPIPVQIISGYPANSLALDSQIIIVPNPVFVDDSFNVTAFLINYDTVNSFKGDIMAGFYNPLYETVELIDTARIDFMLAPLEFLTSPMIFHCNSFFKYDGTYKFGIFRRDSIDYNWSLISSGLYKNPIDLRVINTSDIFNSTNELTDYLIYPNPSKGNFTIKFTEPDKRIMFRVFNVNGEIIKTAEITQFQSTYYIDLSSNIKGIYFLEIIKDNISVRRMISVF